MKNVISVLVTSAHNEDRRRILDNLSDQNDFRIDGIEKDEAGMIIKSAQVKPDVLVMDLQPPAMSADKLAQIIHRRSPSTSIIMLCGKDEEIYAGLALKARISAFLLKNTDTDKLASVVRIVSSGGYFISAPIMSSVFNAILYQKQFHVGSYKNHGLLFTPTERGIIADIARGFSDEETAVHLNISIGTIRNCLTCIRRKTKLKNRTQIVIFSLVNGFINIDQSEQWLMKPPENKNNADKKRNPVKESEYL